MAGAAAIDLSFSHSLWFGCCCAAGQYRSADAMPLSPIFRGEQVSICHTNLHVTWICGPAKLTCAKYQARGFLGSPLHMVDHDVVYISEQA